MSVPTSVFVHALYFHVVKEKIYLVNSSHCINIVQRNTIICVSLISVTAGHVETSSANVAAQGSCLGLHLGRHVSQIQIQNNNGDNYRRLMGCLVAADLPDKVHMFRTM